MHDPDKLETLRDMWREAQESATDAVQTLGTLTHKLIQAETEAALDNDQPHTRHLVIPPDLQQLVDAAPGPAYLIDRYYTVQVANAMSYRLDGRSVVGRNSAWIGFEAARLGCISQEHSLEFTVAGLRAQLDDHPKDLELRRLIRNLHHFPQFAALWDRRRLRIGGCVIARPSPDGAELVFDYECQPIPLEGTDLRLAVGIPRGGTRTRARLDRIAGEAKEGPLGSPRPHAAA